MGSRFRWQEQFKGRLEDPGRAVRDLRSGQRIFIGSGAAEPQLLVSAVEARKPELAGTEIVHIMTLGAAPYAGPQDGGSFRHNALFIGANVRDAVHEGRADYTPVFLSEIPRSRQPAMNVDRCACILAASFLPIARRSSSAWPSVNPANALARRMTCSW